MSFRNTFVTDYIYQASEEVKDGNEAIRVVLKKHSAHLVGDVDERGYGYFAGTLKTLDGSIESMELGVLVHELRQATKVPFRLAIMVESGPVIIHDITP